MSFRLRKEKKAKRSAGSPKPEMATIKDLVKTQEWLLAPRVLEQLNQKNFLGLRIFSSERRLKSKTDDINPLPK